MKNNRIIAYLLVNILVSALTTAGVLVLWDMFHQSQPPIIMAFSTPTPTDAAQGTLPPSSISLLQIYNVYGTGRLDSEMVVVKRVGDGELWLTGWKMVDEQNNVFVFPRLQLNKNSNVNIYTRAGIVTARDLYWGREKAMWHTGEKVRILDPLGNLRAEYVIP